MESGLGERPAVGRRSGKLRARGDAPSPAGSNRNHRYPELDCLRGRLDEGTIAAAAQRAWQAGTGADRVLIATGAIDEEAYLRRLADSLGIPFEPLDRTPRTACPLGDDRLIEAPAAGLLPLAGSGDLQLVVAPRGQAARRIVHLIDARPELAKIIRLTTAARLQSFVACHAADAIGERATNDLARRHRDMSAAPPRRKPPIAPMLAIGITGVIIIAAAPSAAKFACDVFLSLIFLSWMVLRITGLLIGHVRPPRRGRLADRDLPVYTILAPLYREVRSIDALIESLRRLDYPAEKLDIKLIIEPDDHDMRGEFEHLALPSQFEVIVAPQAGPRTKPKALNAALPFARGTFTVIYDAEDRPEPGQLRQALDAFLFHDEAVACVQASLTIDNTADNWLTAMFTAEYAGLFDVFLPALTQLRMPLPLGGSSNHFRTSALRAVGAWDSYNVTEDADLGVRLARFGYRSVAIGSTTYEEAPARLGPWLRQRTRWLKGWMQTWLVHMRHPWQLYRQLGLWPFLTVQLVVGGNVLASLVHPIMIAWLAVSIVIGLPLWSSYAAVAWFGAALAGGYLTSIALGAAGLLRRGLVAHCWVLLLVPLHWLLLSLAAWRALYQLIREPYRWEKTEHGLARTSRIRRRARLKIMFDEITAALRWRPQQAELSEPPQRL
jgi:cellulose synthase/poly-beta-1,6-N-acetylglucosamine synthase-like glycosyltransferase